MSTDTKWLASFVAFLSTVFIILGFMAADLYNTTQCEKDGGQWINRTCFTLEGKIIDR